ncbi:MAG TPA: hypothetical protein VK586_23000 [Streptosporangiaceae bacterium]|nr:hypothetical protein [Streptosporangiaceae bacterium]
MGFGVIGPAIPLLAAHYGVSAALAGLAISAFAAFRFLSALAGGRLLQAVTSILAGLAPTFPLLIAFRSIGGIGTRDGGGAAVCRGRPPRSTITRP